MLGHTLLGFVNAASVLILAVFILTLGELIYVPVKQSTLAEIAKENLRSSYMALNGMVFQGARILGALGITVGASLSPGAMSSLYLLMGLFGLFLFYLVTAHAIWRRVSGFLSCSMSEDSSDDCRIMIRIVTTI
ncbi:hypothetical protein [Effusibacillus pohliae]|uniref:hypothetical protein n=1 Tax=Effusibacillus pohliae TaxID=232270 RepID=UPI0012EA638C|nr:hypothetical protein [Effusibacillus pohliae]